jgi:uncharacterized protein (DUF4415 family)
MTHACAGSSTPVKTRPVVTATCCGTAYRRWHLRQELDKLAAMPDSEIDYSDIPPLTKDQLANAFRPRDKQLISVRLDRDVLEWLKSYGEGYSTRLNGILRTVMEQRQH